MEPGGSGGAPDVRSGAPDARSGTPDVLSGAPDARSDPHLAVSVGAWVVCALAIVGLYVPFGEPLDRSGLGWALAWTGPAVAGALIVSRRPKNHVGLAMMGVGIAVAVETASDGVAGSRFVPGAHNSALANLAVNVNNWATALAFLLLILLILLFPQGRLPRRWRLPTAFLATDCLVLVVALATRPRLHLPRNGSSVANPYHVSGLGDVLQHGVGLMTAVVVLSVPVVVVWAIVRYWKSTGIERLQRKWMALPPLAGIVVFVAALPTDNGGAPNFGLSTLALFIAIDGMAAAVAIAVLRFHLYDIDRVISRTLSYAVLTAILAGVYVGVVSLSTQLIHLQSSFGVAASTLAAAGLFHPLRRRVQAVVDKRFNRSRYDATQLVDAFSSGVRGAVTPELLHAQLADIVHRAVAPSFVSLWTPPASAEARPTS